MQQILDTPEAKTRAKGGVMWMVGAIYELASGRVRFLPLAANVDLMTDDPTSVG